MKRLLFSIFLLLISEMSIAQVAGGAIKRPGKSHSVSKVTPKSQIKSTTNKKRPSLQHNNSKALTGYTNGHAWVDLGLPSGTLWATMNVGASKAEEYGDYFAWGETKSKSDYSWETYKWCKGSYNNMSKYCNVNSSGTVDKKIVLDYKDDTAYINWGEDWCLPTREQFEELFNSKYTFTNWINQNNIQGRKITSRINGNSLFLPAGGFRYNISKYDVNIYGCYWVRMLNSNFPHLAFYTYFDSKNIRLKEYDKRCVGQSVRPITKKNKRYSREELR